MSLLRVNSKRHLRKGGEGSPLYVRFAVVVLLGIIVYLNVTLLQSYHGEILPQNLSDKEMRNKAPKIEAPRWVPPKQEELEQAKTKQLRQKKEAAAEAERMHLRQIEFDREARSKKHQRLKRERDAVKSRVDAKAPVVTPALPTKSERTPQGKKPTGNPLRPPVDSSSVPWATVPVHDYMTEVHRRPECLSKPLIVTMARVQSDLYWQLIQNFFYSMRNFGEDRCAVMICITDNDCARRCRSEGFECFNYNYYTSQGVPDPAVNASAKEIHVYEMIATLKLYHTSIALARGIDLLLIDLDVGFIRNPSELTKGFFENPLEQARAQMDVGYSMDKQAKFWYTHPRPNFGLFLVKSEVAGNFSVKLFERAWLNYNKFASESKRARVATDQNHLANTIKWARWRSGYNFSYFDIGHPLDTKPRPVLDLLAPLLDKTKMHSDRGIAFELGGDVAKSELKGAIAVHATCYEGQTKLLALKAAGAFLNPTYYTPSRRTLTKPLMSVTPESLYRELASLIYLSIKSNRALIIPNILVGAAHRKYVLGQPAEGVCGGPVGGRGGEEKMSSVINMGSSEVTSGLYGIEKSFYCRETTRRLWFTSYRIITQKLKHVARVGNEYYWPGFRVLNNIGLDKEILEPGFYARAQEVQASGFNKDIAVPEPFVLSFDIGKRDGHAGMELGVGDILKLMEADGVRDEARLVLGPTDSRYGFMGPERMGYPGGATAIKQWAKGTHSAWVEPQLTAATSSVKPVNKASYVALPPLSTLMNSLSIDLDSIGDMQPKSDLAHSIFHDVKMCANFLRKVDGGNRTCFATCK